MRKYLVLGLLFFAVATHTVASETAPVSQPAVEMNGTELAHLNKDQLRSKKHKPTKLKSSYPWEYIEDNVKTFKFVVMNFYTDLFDPKTVLKLSKAIEAYVEKNVYPSWRSKVTIEFFIPPSQQELANDALLSGQFINATPQPGTFIPIILTNDFSSNIPSNFATALHGNVSASPTTGYNASLYIDDDFYTLTGPFPFGTPFIVIPAGTMDDGNGISGQIAANQLSGQGPTDFYQALSLVMSQEIISLLIEPTVALYEGSGNPLGGPTGGPLPDGSTAVTSQIFYLQDATSPFLYGNDNIVRFCDWSMGNFALPAYFMPLDNSGHYDFLGRTSAPFTPYKGSQFLIYQNFITTDYPTGTYTDLLIGTNVSPLDNPAGIQLFEGGSIYDYSGWGMQTMGVMNNAKPSDTFTTRLKGDLSHVAFQTSKTNIPTVLNSSFAVGRNRNSKDFQQGLSGSKFTKKSKSSKKANKPKLLPFQYIDNDGFLTTRIGIINYIPSIISPVEIDKMIPVLEKYINEEYLPYYNVRATYTSYTVLPGDIGLPKFDGTFIPFFLLNLDQFDTNKIGSLVIGGGATNVNNVPNILAGPEISEYLQATADFSVPVLPLANPYLMISSANFPGQVSVSTDQDGLGPFTAIPTGSSVLIPTSFPIVALGADADPLDACTTLVNDLTGKIGVNQRSGACDSTVYPNNIAAAGAVAFLTVYDPGAQVFDAPGATIWGATLGSDGDALIAALASNPAITITIAGPVASTTDLNTLTEILTHETEELSSDSSYAKYILTFDPGRDTAVLFSQYEPADPTESINVFATKYGNSFAMECFPLPCYYVAYLKNNNFDNSGIISRALVPESRQQVVFHFQNEPETPYNPLHWGNVLGVTEDGFDPELSLQDNGNIFDPFSFYPPQTPEITTPIPATPLGTIYDALVNLRDVLLI